MYGNINLKQKIKYKSEMKAIINLILRINLF